MILPIVAMYFTYCAVATYYSGTRPPLSPPLPPLPQTGAPTTWAPHAQARALGRRVVKRESDVHPFPDDTGGGRTLVEPGESVDVLQVSGEWAEVRLDSGETGYLRRSALGPSATRAAPEPAAGGAK